MTVFAEIAGLRTQSAGDLRDPRDLRDLRDEVCAHLLRLCSIRRGSMLTAPEYGVDDPTRLFHSFPGGLDAWLVQLEESVRRYEPRLTDVRVEANLDERQAFTLAFEIRGTLVGRGRREAARFTASVDPTQRWKLR